MIFIISKLKSSGAIKASSGKVFALGIVFDEDNTSLEYTMIIHNYLNYFED
ncbi:hypothetical protein QIA19_04970 (plasmid) [Borreliella finlandensis]|uniref:Uncharacterized protein n=1 Tax=Borreliella finlandensis TaxID=498741 RepID=A0A806CN54_9SPIR|nr:hypothetical protein [Borreliella finlandensis]ACN93527.1 conserved hypothetical protein [Borreliella finlandensis]